MTILPPYHDCPDCGKKECVTYFDRPYSRVGMYFCVQCYTKTEATCHPVSMSDGTTQWMGGGLAIKEDWELM